MIYSEKEFSGLWISKIETEVLLQHGNRYRVMAEKKLNTTNNILQVLQLCDKICSNQIIHPDVITIFDSIN